MFFLCFADAMCVVLSSFDFAVSFISSWENILRFSAVINVALMVTRWW